MSQEETTPCPLQRVLDNPKVPERLKAITREAIRFRDQMEIKATIERARLTSRITPPPPSPPEETAE